jgi:hypothetical protein
VRTIRVCSPSTFTSAPAMGAPPATVTVPCKVPVGPRGEASTAAKASRRPWPKPLLFSGVPPQVGSGVSAALPSRMARVASISPTRDGAADHISATTPARWGVAMEVPLALR